MPMSIPLAKAISEALEKFAARGERRLIPRGKDQIAYLYRNFLEGKPAPDGEPGLLLHKFVASDTFEQLHNHPWTWSVSFILEGSYRETREVIQTRQGNGKILLRRQWQRDFKPGDHNYIARNDFHRVDLISNHVWTLFLHGPREGDWSFVPENYGEFVIPRMVTKRTFDVREKVDKAVR